MKYDLVHNKNRSGQWIAPPFSNNLILWLSHRLIDTSWTRRTDLTQTPQCWERSCKARAVFWFHNDIAACCRVHASPSFQKRCQEEWIKAYYMIHLIYVVNIPTEFWSNV